MSRLENIRAQSAIYFIPKKQNGLRSGEKAPWSRALSVLAEDLTSILSSHVYPEAGRQCLVDPQL